MSRIDLSDDSMCFACGKRNEQGLKLSFEEDGEDVVASVSFARHFQGYRGIVHGGLISTVLDEAMVTLVNRLGFLAVTADLSVRFLRPLPVETPVRVRARLVARRRNVFKLESVASLADGTEVARARSTFLAQGAATE
ncbi:MAG: PaaI family thioesterase [Candidatus Eisenbacteria bacterium]